MDKNGVVHDTMRTFSTGATRNNDPTRIDFIKMLSIPALFSYADYMRAHRKQADGNLREFDNWKGGFPPEEILESLLRHVLDLIALHHGIEPMRECEIEETCCAIKFNIDAYLHQFLCK